MAAWQHRPYKKETVVSGMRSLDLARRGNAFPSSALARIPTISKLELAIDHRRPQFGPETFPWRTLQALKSQDILRI